MPILGAGGSLEAVWGCQYMGSVHGSSLSSQPAVVTQNLRRVFGNSFLSFYTLPIGWPVHWYQKAFKLFNTYKPKLIK